MKTSVTLQEPFSYAIWPILFLGVVITLYGVYLVISFARKNQGKKEPMKQIVRPQNTVINKNHIKHRYLMKLETIKQELCREEITTRKAYEKMSLFVRQFVYEVTGIKVQNNTLSDIKKLHMPSLEALMTEYYASEFPLDSKGDSMEAIEKTKRAIELWN